jgi:proteic killer suppression protein
MIRSFACDDTARLFRREKARVFPPDIRINDQWRICFRWESDGPHDVEIVDYH